MQFQGERTFLLPEPAHAGTLPQPQAQTHGVAWRTPWWTGAGLRGRSRSSRAYLEESSLQSQTRRACRALRRHAAPACLSSLAPVQLRLGHRRGPAPLSQGVVRTCSQANPGYAVVVADDAEVQETIRRAAPSLLPVFALLTGVERADLWHASSAVPGQGRLVQCAGLHELSADTR